jgi:hypothetical protein
MALRQVEEQYLLAPMASGNSFPHRRHSPSISHVSGPASAGSGGTVTGLVSRMTVLGWDWRAGDARALF